MQAVSRLSVKVHGERTLTRRCSLSERTSARTLVTEVWTYHPCLSLEETLVDAAAARAIVIHDHHQLQYSTSSQRRTTSTRTLPFLVITSTLAQLSTPGTPTPPPSPAASPSVRAFNNPFLSVTPCIYRSVVVSPIFASGTGKAASSTTASRTSMFPLSVSNTAVGNLRCVSPKSCGRRFRFFQMDPVYSPVRSSDESVPLERIECPCSLVERLFRDPVADNALRVEYAPNDGRLAEAGIEPNRGSAGSRVHSPAIPDKSETRWSAVSRILPLPLLLAGVEPFSIRMRPFTAGFRSRPRRSLSAVGGAFNTPLRGGCLASLPAAVDEGSTSNATGIPCSRARTLLRSFGGGSAKRE